jgi:hypothetical protein
LELKLKQNYNSLFGTMLPKSGINLSKSAILVKVFKKASLK